MGPFFNLKQKRLVLKLVSANLFCFYETKNSKLKNQNEKLLSPPRADEIIYTETLHFDIYILHFYRRGSSAVERRTENPCVDSSTLSLGTESIFNYKLRITNHFYSTPFQLINRNCEFVIEYRGVVYR